MCPITIIVFFIFFGFPVLNALSGDDGVTPVINVTKCFTLPEVELSFHGVNKCFYDIVKAQINKTSTEPRNCNNVIDLENQYDNLITTLGIYCTHLNFSTSNPNINTSVTILDVLKVALDSEKFSEFIIDGGLKCLQAISKPISTCRTENVEVYADHYNKTKFSFWKRTMRLTIDSFNCGQQDSFLNCTMAELNAHCEEKSISYIKSVLDVFTPKCEEVKNLAQTAVPVEEASTAVYWVVGALAIIAIAGVILFFVKKRKTREHNTVMEMK